MMGIDVRKIHVTQVHQPVFILVKHAKPNQLVVLAMHMQQLKTVLGRVLMLAYYC
jgi:hypothetical protein